MAFAATNVKTRGLSPSLKITTGKWTGSVGDGTGTMTLQGGVCFGGQLWQNTAGGWVQAPFSFTASGNLITLTVENVAPVTDGYFHVFHA